MNRLIRDHYPVSKLPDDLREGFEGQTDVRVTIDRSGAEIDTTQDGPLPTKTLAELFAMGRPTFTTADEIDDHVQALRKEWD